MDDIQFSEFLDESIPLWRDDPVMFFREVLSFEPDEWQAQAARDLAANPKVSIKSGQGVGKTGLEAAVFLWFITNNAAAIYSECAGQVQSTFAQGFTASADVAVTLNWHITNPSASISTSSSGSSVSATIAGHASGGEVGLNGAELSWVGEEGLEYIIPTVPARRQRGIELWKSAGRTLGVLGPDDEISAHASGGIVGKEVSNTTPYFDTDSSSQDSEKSEKETVPTNVVSDKSGVVVQVNLSPQFNISDTNDSDVIRLIKAHIKELADDLGSEIATMLSEAYENTPVTT